MASVIKADQSREAFSEKKVIESIKRARIPQELQSEVLNHVKEKIYDGIPTSEIYHHITEFLGGTVHPYSRSRYSLKESIMLLGPTGYPFEDFIARLVESLGYTASVRQILSGKCITHEIDVVAEKDGKRAAIEAKFHNSPGTRSEVHVALYTKSRFDDIKERNKIDESWLVTNTKTTTDVNTYALCVGMQVMSWDYPEGKGLRDLVEKQHLYPITMLTSLPQTHKVTLLSNHIVLCKDIFKNPSLIDILPLSKEEKEKTLAEVRFICNEENAA